MGLAFLTWSNPRNDGLMSYRFYKLQKPNRASRPYSQGCYTNSWRGLTSPSQSTHSLGLTLYFCLNSPDWFRKPTKAFVLLPVFLDNPVQCRLGPRAMILEEMSLAYRAGSRRFSAFSAPFLHQTLSVRRSKNFDRYDRRKMRRNASLTCRIVQQRAVVEMSMENLRRYGSSSKGYTLRLEALSLVSAGISCALLPCISTLVIMPSIRETHTAHGSYLRGRNRVTADFAK